MTLFQHAANYGEANWSQLYEAGFSPEEYAGWYVDNYPAADAAHPHAFPQFLATAAGGTK